jgi:hypothetical protein
VLFDDFRADPEAHRLGTPSGKIELWSETIARFRYSDCPPHPTWLPPAEWLGSSQATRFPLHLVTNQPRERLHAQMDPGPVAHVYRPLGRQYIARLNVQARQATRGGAEPSVMLRELRQAIQAVDARVAVLNVSTLEEARDSSPTSWLVRAAGQAFGALGVLALAIAATGLYGVKAYLVTQRRREIGIRLALGSTPENMVTLIVKEGALLLGGGVAVGFVLAVGAGRIVGRLLVGVRPVDPLVLVLATSSLALAVLAASYIPARRATRVDPAVTLRDE